MPDAEAFDAVAKLGAGALFAIAVFAFYTRRVRTRGEVEENDAKADARLAEMRADRDAWRKIAEQYGEKLDELTRILTLIVGWAAKLEEILEQLRWIRDRVGKLLGLVERIVAKVLG